MGKSPAFNIRMKYSVHRYDWRFVGAGRQAVPIETRAAIQSNSVSRKVMFSGETTEHIPHSEWDSSGRVQGDAVGIFFLCVSIAYDLDPLGEKVGHETRVLVIERQEGAFGPVAHTILEVPSYQSIE